MLWTMYIGVLIMGVGRTNFDVITRQTIKVHRDRIFSGYGPRSCVVVVVVVVVAC